MNDSDCRSTLTETGVVIGDDQRVTDLSPCLRDLVVDVHQLRRVSIQTASDHGRRRRPTMTDGTIRRHHQHRRRRG